MRRTKSRKLLACYYKIKTYVTFSFNRNAGAGILDAIFLSVDKRVHYTFFLNEVECNLFLLLCNSLSLLHISNLIEKQIKERLEREIGVSQTSK